MIRKPKIDNFHIFNTLTLPNRWSGTLKILMFLFVLEHHHDILRFQISMQNANVVQKHNSLDNIADYKCALKLVQVWSALHVLKQILAIDVLGDDILEIFCMQSLLVLHNLRVINNLHRFTLVGNGFSTLGSQFLQIDCLECIHLISILFDAFVHNGKLPSPDHLPREVIRMQSILLIYFQTVHPLMNFFRIIEK